jgi:CubicO group peptidase (beta-lactamase class C family)
MINAKFLATNPEDVGLDPEKIDELLARVAQEIDAGLLPGCQMAIAREGRIAAFATFGDATDESLFNIFSCTKAITSAAAWLLIQEGLLDVTERVVDVVPEFTGHGKDVITVEQLFCHTAGFPHAPLRPVDWADREVRLQRYRDWTLNWEPGTRYEYHPTSSMYVIAELIERRAGIDYADFVRERVFAPLELSDLWLGCPVEQHDRIQPVTHVGETLTSEDYADMGLPEPPVSEVTEDALSSFNKPEVREVPVAGGGAVTNAAELALFYQGLLHGGALGGPRIWTDETLAFGRTVRNEFPDYLGTPAHRALGVSVAGDKLRNRRGFGHTNSPLAFGHGGAGGQIGWADPETGISFSYTTNGHDRNPIRNGRRIISISNRAAVCAS